MVAVPGLAGQIYVGPHPCLETQLPIALRAGRVGHATTAFEAGGSRGTCFSLLGSPRRVGAVWVRLARAGACAGRPSI